MSAPVIVAFGHAASRLCGRAALASLLLASVSGTAFAAAAPASAPPAEVDALVVRADPLAEVAGDIKPEIQLTPDQIQGLGVGTASELLGEITAQTTGADDQGPVILLNGRQISGTQEINDIPTEAIQRVDVLPEEASTRFGYSGAQRVVNIVLTPTYRGLTVEMTGAMPTEGGRFSGAANGNAFVIKGNDRFNLGIRYNAATALTEDERDLMSRATVPFSTAGNLVGLGGGEIDPALSALAGRPVTVAGVPASAGSRAPTLADFGATAGTANVDDSGAFRTLTAKTERISANLVVAKSISQSVSGTLNVTLGANQSESLRGLPSLVLTLPTGSPYSPFTREVALNRYAAGLDPLAQDNNSWNGRVAGALRIDFGQWRTNLTANYDHTDNLTHTDVGLSPADLQAQLNARSIAFNPFAPLPGGLTILPQQKSRSLTDSVNVRFLARRPLFRLPAGQVSSSFRLSDAQDWSNNTSLRQTGLTKVELSRNTLGGQATISAPLTSRRNNFLGAVGDLSVNANVAIDHVSDFGDLNTIGFGANWTPLTQLQFRVSYSNEDRAPSLQQLGGPVISAPNTRVFDYVTGASVDVTSVTGGNPGLRGEERDILRLSANYKPLSKLNLTFTAAYSQTRIENPVQSFPAITAEIQAAFPERFTRDPTGRLLVVDTRPVNFQRSQTSQLRWGVNFVHSFARPQPQRLQGRPGAAPGQFQGQRPPGQGGQGQRPPGQGAPGQGAQGQGAQGQGGQRPGAAGPAGQAGQQGVRAPGGAGGQGRPGGAPGGQGNFPGAGGPPGQFVGGPGGPGGGVLVGPPGDFAGGPPDGGGFGGPGGGDFGGGFGGGGFGGGFAGGGGFGGGGFAGGGGGGGPGGRGGGGGDQLQFALYHTVFFEDRLFIRPGLPALDFLDGAASNSRGGRSRHQVEVQAGYNKRPLGVRVVTTWQSATQVQGTGGGTGSLRFSSLTTTNLRLFANLGQMQTWARKYPVVFENARLTLSVNNLFNKRQEVRDINGVTPLNYQPGYLDPVGREVRLELRKQF